MKPPKYLIGITDCDDKRVGFICKRSTCDEILKDIEASIEPLGYDTTDIKDYDLDIHEGILIKTNMPISEYFDLTVN